jgi:hypothetical protein
MVAVPLSVQNSVTGVLEVFSNSARAFSDSDIDHLKRVAGFADAAMLCLVGNSIALPVPVTSPEAVGALPSMIANCKRGVA